MSNQSQIALLLGIGVIVRAIVLLGWARVMLPHLFRPQLVFELKFMPGFLAVAALFWWLLR